MVVSRVKKYSLQRRPDGGFGVTFRGNSPVFIRSVDFDSHARTAGLRSGDLLVSINGRNVRLEEKIFLTTTETLAKCLYRYATKIEVLELLKSTKEVLQLTVVARGLAPAMESSSSAGTAERRRGRKAAVRHQSVSQERMAMRYEKARVFHSKVKLLGGGGGI